MASWAEARVDAATVATPLPRSRPKPHTRPVARPHAVTGGVLWIVIAAVLLAGVVAVNVAVLQNNVRLDQLGRERVQLRADNARLESQLSSSIAPARIEGDARSRLGLVPADPNTTSYVELAPSTK